MTNIKAFSPVNRQIKFGSNSVNPPEMPLVILESPFGSNDPKVVEKNISYARMAVRDSLLRGEAPIASHLLYTQPGILDDNIPKERELGINAGLAWRKVAQKSVVYTDRGITKGMEYGIKAAESAGNPVEYRTIPENSESLSLLA